MEGFLPPDLPSLCPKCNRWYNPSTQHICAQELPDLITERKKLTRWLGTFEMEQ